RQLKELTDGRHPTGLSDILGRDGRPLVKRTDFSLIAEISLGDASIVYNPVELRIPDINRVLEQSY
ncbi:MAG TPA: alcohol dehydrogenase, partial [Spirochaeta sp.]|nr:alcohol dehydrogenase [Spirochaeta sp.]